MVSVPGLIQFDLGKYLPDTVVDHQIRICVLRGRVAVNDDKIFSFKIFKTVL